MVRPTRNQSRTARRRGEAAIKLIAAGLALTLGPLFVSGSPFGKAIASLIPIGLMMLAAGAFFIWLDKQSDAVAPDAPARRAYTPRTPSRRVVAESTPDALPFTDVVPVSNAPTSAAATPSRPQAWDKRVFKVIEWRRFEAVVERLFQQAGFETRSQSHGADGGVDIWLYSRNQPGAPVSIVQCKHWQGKAVGVDKMRELRGVMAAHNVSRGQFATTSTYTPDATTFARENGINPLDVDGLLGLIGKRSPSEQSDLLAVALEGDYWRPTCVNCGLKMVDKIPRKGGKAFWGCATFPRCRHTMTMRSD